MIAENFNFARKNDKKMKHLLSCYKIIHMFNRMSLRRMLPMRKSFLCYYIEISDMANKYFTRYME